MSKHISPWHPSLLCSVWIEELVINAAMQVTNPTQPDESTRVTGEPQNCSEALLLLRLQDYANTLARTQQSLEATCTSLQRTELLSGIISEQDLRTLGTACSCLNSLRIRVEAQANTTERTVIRQQVIFMQTRVQPCPAEELGTNDTSCPSRTSAEHFD